MIIQGHTLTEQKELPAESVHCVVTSPPYWNGMRDYQLLPVVWDDPGDCDHEDWEPDSIKGQFCRCCGAWKGSLGDEPSVGLYIKHLVDIFQETYRVLHRQGQLFINISDSRTDRQWAGVPWRLALALQDAGWRWEDEIIWVKDNYSPGSHTNRTVRAHEIILVMNKNPDAYWDHYAIREVSSSTERERRIRELIKGMTKGQYNIRSLSRDGQAEPGINGAIRSRQARIDASASGFRNRQSIWNISAQPFTLEMCRSCRQIYSRATYTQLPRKGDNAARRRVAICRCGSTDWISHFGTFPEDLVRLCVMAGSSERGCCPACLNPWERIIEKRFVKLADRMPERRYRQLAAMDVNSRDEMGFNELQHIGWKPQCECGARVTIPCTVLDLFGGVGTTAKVAQELGRDWIMIELQEDYILLLQYQISARQEVMRLS